MRFSALLVKLSLGIAIIALCNSALVAQDAELVRHFMLTLNASLLSVTATTPQLERL